MPPSAPPPEYLDDTSRGRGSRPATPNRDPSVDGDASTVASGVSGTGKGDGEAIATCLFDRKGYCVRHPRVRLRRKKLLGGWQVLIANCPDCCVEEMGRLKRVRKSMGKDKGKKDKKKKDKKKKKKDRGRGKEASDPGGGEEPRRDFGRSRSRGRMPEVKNDPKIRSRSQSQKSRLGRGESRGVQRSVSRGGPRRDPPNQNEHGNSHVFEFDIQLDERGDVTSPRSVRSARSRKSHKSATTRKSIKSGRSGKSAKTNKSSKSARTNKSSKSTRTNKSSKSTRTNKSSKSTRTKKSSKSRGRSKSKSGNGDTVVSRGSHAGSSQRFIRQKNLLRVAKMPYVDKYGREGKFTGEIDEHGVPNGHGTLRYNNGTVFEGLWEEGRARDMDEKMDKAREGFAGNWKKGTKAARKEREKRKEQDMDDLRSFISQSVRSGSVGEGGGGSYLGSTVGGSQFGSADRSIRHSRSKSDGRRRQKQGREGEKQRVEEKPWSDVNGFSGHYTGEVNADHVPDGHGYMRYSNGVVEEGTFRNGVYQPSNNPPSQSSRGGQRGDDAARNQGGGGIPSSSMSVWSLKSSPTMAFMQGGHSVLTGQRPSGAVGTPTSVHLGGPSSGGGMYANLDDDRY